MNGFTISAIDLSEDPANPNTLGPWNAVHDPADGTCYMPCTRSYEKAWRSVRSAGNGTTELANSKNYSEWLAPENLTEKLMQAYRIHTKKSHIIKHWIKADKYAAWFEVKKPRKSGQGGCHDFTDAQIKTLADHMTEQIRQARIRFGSLVEAAEEDEAEEVVVQDSIEDDVAYKRLLDAHELIGWIAEEFARAKKRTKIET